MSDGMLPRCTLHPDVKSVHGSLAVELGARGVGGGFPCQARQLIGET